MIGYVQRGRSKCCHYIEKEVVDSGGPVADPSQIFWTYRSYCGVSFLENCPDTHFSTEPTQNVTLCKLCTRIIDRRNHGSL
jgi:hypothetical protein